MRSSPHAPLSLVLAAGALLACARSAPGVQDALPSWNDTAPKQAIIAFVQKITTVGSPDFVPVPERIAVFDNDGTLWAEKPMPFQLLFAFDEVKRLAPKHPEWKTREPFASLLRGDVAAVAASGEKGVLEIVTATHSGMTTDEFSRSVEAWIASARHPQTGRLLTAMVYQPMLELLTYLRANGFKTFIVSGGGVEFMRAWAERIYDVPPEQVVGSAGKLRLDARDGTPVLVKLPAIDLIDDKEGKPVGIQSDGDLQMLQWTMAGDGARFALLVHHDDDQREYAYDRADRFQRLDKAWDEAIARGWSVVSMKQDWNTVFPPK